MAVLTLAQDDFRARRPRIGTCSLTPGDAEAVASPRLKPGPRPGQACGRIGGERSLGLIGQFVLRIHQRAFREMLVDLSYQ